MPKQGKFSLRPSARLQRYIGEELISDPNLAVLEFVKNAYDAGASRVDVTFTLTSDPTTLVISDDGVGMDAKSFEQNWMHPGFSRKSLGEEERSEEGPATRARDLATKRTPAGEKGLGRMAAGRLAERLDVYTRTTEVDPWLHVAFVWSDFDDMTKAMDQVVVPYDYTSSPPTGVPEAGTTVVMSGLRLAWDGRVRGRPVAGRSRTRLGRLKQDLEFLVRPITAAAAESNFSVELRSDSVDDPADRGRISQQALTLSGEYTYEFAFETDDKGAALVRRTVKRSPRAAALVGKPEEEDLGTERLTKRKAKADDRPAGLACGPFEGRFLYTPPPAARRALEVESTVMGVLLYRDGVLVEPYGIDGNDWVGVSSRKAQRQGHAAIQPNTFTGSVMIGREANPDLQDMSNRMGLLDNEASEEFQAQVRAEFRNFESLVYEEVNETRWEGKKEEKAGRRAEEAAGLADMYVRSLAHGIRQPLTGVQAELGLMRVLAQRDDVPQQVASIISDMRERMARHLDRATALVRQVLELKVPDFTDVSPLILVEQAVEQVRPAADAANTLLTIQGLAKSEVLVPGGFVVQALASLLANAIEAPRPEGRSPEVTVQIVDAHGDTEILIHDNGSGIANADPSTPFETIASTKGRPQVGLVSARVMVVSARGRLTLERTGSDGTTFRVLLPERAAGLRDGGRTSS